MKNLYITISALLLSVTLFAQAPQKMSYQAVVRSASDALVANQLVGLQISILQGSISGTSVYRERHMPTSNINGLVTLEIGTGIVSLGDFSAIDWGNGPYFLKTQYDLTGGSNYTITGTSQFLSVPYALYASIADSVRQDTAKHYVGELFGGGIVYAVWDNGRRGLIVSLDDINSGNGTSWGYGSLAPTGATSFFDGAANTTAILNAIGPVGAGTYAAKLCDDYNAGGFTDWYLPSYGELRQISSVLAIIEKVLTNDGNPASNAMYYYGSPVNGGRRYWCSTETSGGNTAYIYYSGGASPNSSALKNSFYNVRAVRAF